MNSLTISELAIATKGKLVIGNESDTINDIVIDSRKANKDNVFVAVIGENLDGHQFMQSAYENGCKTFIKNASTMGAGPLIVILTEVFGLHNSNPL